ncbi:MULTISPECIES: hypothetical protein [unclassified Helicobacter]|nr:MULTISPECIES: hypothetical protein [unclassified Helicobacter]
MIPLFRRSLNFGVWILGFGVFGADLVDFCVLCGANTFDKC